MFVAHSSRQPDGSTRTRATSVNGRIRLVIAAFFIITGVTAAKSGDYQSATVLLVIAAYPLISGLRILYLSIGLKLWP